MARFSMPAALVTFTLAGGGSALACESLDEAMTDFRSVADAFSAQAASISPDKFPIWTAEVQKFSDAMGQMNYTDACSVLVTLVDRLELEVELAHARGSAPSASAPAAGGSGSGSGGDSIAATAQAGSGGEGTRSDGGASTPAPRTPVATPPSPPPVTPVAAEPAGGMRVRDRARPPRLW